jgi:uncharacterized protein (TIGR02246 family)
MGPDDVVGQVGERLSRGDLEGTLALYEPDAAFAPRPGEIVAGAEAIRAALEGFVALKPRMTGEVTKVVEAGDTALVVNRWSLLGTAPDGAPLAMSGTSADVLRRQPDGRWLVAIDDPWGGEAAV